jgi:hypothetical protein
MAISADEMRLTEMESTESDPSVSRRVTVNRAGILAAVVTVLPGTALGGTESRDAKNVEQDAVPLRTGVATIGDAQIAIQKGRLELLTARLAKSDDEKIASQRKAREFFAAAREIYQADYGHNKAAYDKFDKFIPRSEKARYDARERVYLLYIQAQLNLALVDYEEALSWNKGSDENKRLLLKAATAFDAIHARYRQMIAGLYARMWQGKCFDEQGDLVKALGIYNELLGHGGDNPSPPLTTLQDRVRLFRLVCLNHEGRRDFQVVIDEAEKWLKANAETATTRTGLGIQWELARALESQALGAETDVFERDRLLQRALETAREINRHDSEYQDGSRAMIERLKRELKEAP